MSAGKYNKKIIIKQRLVTTDAYNQAIESWSTFRSVWAELQIGQGREYYAAKRNIPTLSGLINIRFMHGIKPSMQIVYGEKIYNILAIIPKGKQLNDELELHVEEVIAK